MNLLKPLIALVAGCAVLAGCGGGGSGAGTGPIIASGCSDTAKKDFILATAREWYLFPELLPASIDPNAASTPTAFLDALTATARAQSKDRFFSYVTSITAEQQVLAEGTSVGFGVSLRQTSNTTRLFIGQVFEGSAAAEALFLRGDEILQIGTSAATLENVSAILARGGLTEALGPAEAGITRVFRVRTASGGTVDRSVTKRQFSINPVPSASVRLIARPGQSPVGYFLFRSFISPADDALRSAFTSFRNAQPQVRDVIVDLRYNGGGLVSTAELLMNLLAGDRQPQVMYRTRLNPSKSSQEQSVAFTNLTQTLPTQRIAFITTESSASASELAINSLYPYAQVAIVGTTTFGKPVGQTAHDISSCDFRMRLVTFKLVNNANSGDYYTGLPDAAYNSSSGDAFCPGNENFLAALGDPNENLTAGAISWINSGVCPTIADTGGGLAKLSASETLRAAAADEPRDALRHYLPGTF
jgi:C-terminal processing protease CtpA/Prc